MKRVIFDLDGTLLNASWDEEKDFFKKRMNNNENTMKFINNVANELLEYEDTHLVYSILDLVKFLQSKNYDVDTDLIVQWMEFVENTVKDEVCPEVFETLEYLKEKGIKMSVSSNWFTSSQIGRLRRAGILDYFDVVIGGDYALKPDKANLLLASNGTDPMDCLMIGNHYKYDYMGAVNAGMTGVLIDENNSLLDIVKSNKNKVYVKKDK